MLFPTDHFKNREKEGKPMAQRKLRDFYSTIKTTLCTSHKRMEAIPYNNPMPHSIKVQEELPQPFC